MSEATIPAQGPVDVLVGRLRTHAEAHEYIANADPEQKQWMNDLYDAADAIERAPRWRDVADELPQEAQEVLFVRGGKTVHGAWIGGIFWHSNQKMAAAYWMPLPLPPNNGWNACRAAMLASGGKASVQWETCESQCTCKVCGTVWTAPEPPR